MAEVLSQNEIDALLNALSKGEISSEPEVAGESKAIKIYDFKHPDRFSKDQTRTLEMLHDQFARLVSTQMSTLLRTIVEVRLASVDQLSYDEFIQSIPKPTSINIIRLSPLEGNGLVEISPSLAFTIVDRLMGGVGNDTRRNRELTDIEKAVIKKILGYTLESLQEAWEVVIHLEPTLEIMETNPQIFMQLFMPSEMVILLTFEVSLGGQTGTLSICIPYVVLEPVARQLSSRSWFSASRKDRSPELIQAVESRVKRVNLPVVVTLGETELDVQDLLALRVGDILPLEQSVHVPVTVEVDKHMCFLGVPGKRGNNKAVKIVKRVDMARTA